MKLPHNVSRVLDAVLGHEGEAPQAVRVAVADRATVAGGGIRSGSVVPDNLQAYVDKVTHTPYKVMDEDIDSLKKHGYSEDQIYEITIATALGAAAGRLEKTLQLLDEDEK